MSEIQALNGDAAGDSLFGGMNGYCRCGSCGGFHAVYDTGETSPYGALNADDRGEVGPNGKESFTTAEAAAQLGRSNVSWGSGLGQGATVTFAFRSSAATLPSDVSDFSRFNAAQISATLTVLTGWSDVANIRFQQVQGADGYSNSATMLFGNYGAGAEGSAAFAYLPGSTGTSSNSGDVWINGSIGYNNNPVFLGYGYQVLAHEVGHAIGLSHPASYNAGEGVTISYTADAVYYEDSRQYTIMSYFGETNTGGNFNTASGARQYSAAPMLDDIAAAQRLYGANTTTRTGDTVYGFNSNADRVWYTAASASADVIFAVWDAGGTDTLDFSGYADAQLIDLRQGAFSNVGGLTGNVAIAIGAVIENAVGGSGADRLVGNGSDNRLTGGAGNDTLDGGVGADTAVYSGARASYVISYAGQTVTVSGPDGTDVLTNIEVLQFADGAIATTPTGGVTLSGDIGNNVLNGTTFADTLSGLGGADTLNGLGGDDVLDGGTGADTLSGGDGNDILVGGAGDDRLDGGAGYDVAEYAAATGPIVVDLSLSRVTGAMGTDTLVGIEEVRGSAFDDRMTGGAGADVLRGGGGIDTLDGGAGDDRLYAGAAGQTGGAADIVKGAATANAAIGSAVSLDAGFDLLARDGVANATTIPHATVIATTHGGLEYYAFTVAAGARATFDIDNASFDSTLRLFNAQGVELASNDDSASDGGPSTDSGLSYTFTTAGTYYIQVALWLANANGTFTSGPPAANGTYTLHTSISGHAVVAATLLGSTLLGDAGADSLYGGAGGDTLSGGAGNDVIDGGAGDDLAVYSGSASDYVLTRVGAGWQINGSQGLDTLTNVERIQFGSATPIAIDGAVTARFDPLTYIASNPDLIVAFGTNTAAATAHYEQYQSLYPRSINSFYALTYVASNRDLIGTLGTNATAATLHYIQTGFAEGRPTASFNPLIYAASSVDLALAFGTNATAAAGHYITYGVLGTHPASGFNPYLYLASNADLARSIGFDYEAGLRHYLDVGVREGRPASGFDPLVYVASHADLTRIVGLNQGIAVQHYLTWGADEGRSINAFDPRLYAASHLDIARVLGSDLGQATAHYIQYGFYEGRATSGFDSVAYLLSNSDLAGRTASQALDHWLLFGADQGRVGDALFGREQTSNALTGASTSGTIGVAGDRDWFQLNMVAGQRIQIDQRGVGAGTGTLADGTLQLYDSLGRLVASDADSGPGADARIVFTATTAGVYYIVVTGAGASAGTYQIATAAASPLEAAIDVAPSAETEAAATMALMSGDVTGDVVAVQAANDDVDAATLTLLWTHDHPIQADLFA